MAATLLLGLRLIMVVALYAFLAWAFLALWRDLSQRSTVLADRRVPTINLILEDPDEPVEYRFNRPQLTIGRNPTCDCVIEDETVSAQHTRLIFRHNQWWIDDLASTNGTFLNGQRIAALTVLTSGDQVRIGQIDLFVSIGDPND